MAKNLDQILVVDVETTCWNGQPPPGEMSEIIKKILNLTGLTGLTGLRN